MRIGIDYRPVTAAPYSGIARQVLALEQALLESGVGEVVRFTAAPAGHPHRRSCVCSPREVATTGLHRPRERLSFELGFLPGAIKREGISLYIATANAGLPWPRPSTLRKQVVLVHDLFQLTLPGRYASALHRLVYGLMDRALIGHAVRAADRIWTPSRFSGREISWFFPRQAHKIQVLPNAVPALAPAQMEGLPVLPARFWLVVGTREPRKNIAMLLQQWHAVRSAGEQLPELVLVGDRGDVPAQWAGLPGVHWMGGITDAQLSALYHRAERLLHPAYAEGFGLPVIEAMRCGTPVAAATGSALDELLPAQALRFDPYNAAQIQAALRKAAAGRLPEEQAAVLQQHAQRFDTAHYQAQVRHLLDELA